MNAFFTDGVTLHTHYLPIMWRVKYAKSKRRKPSRDVWCTTSGLDRQAYGEPAAPALPAVCPNERSLSRSLSELLAVLPRMFAVCHSHYVSSHVSWYVTSLTSRRVPLCGRLERRQLLAAAALSDHRQAVQRGESSRLHRRLAAPGP